MNMNDALKLLPEHTFVRIHKSCELRVELYHMKFSEY